MKNKPKIRSNILINTALAAGLLFCTTYVGVHSSIRKMRKQTYAYQDHIDKLKSTRFDPKILELRSRLPQIVSECIEKQEERTGIKHFGVPKATLKGTYCRYEVSFGHYDEKENTINIDTTTTNPEKIKRKINHLLGYFYTDKLREKLELKIEQSKDIPENNVSTGTLGDKFDGINKKLDNILILLYNHKIEDGIAKYFEGGDDACASISTIKAKKLVKPIIDQYGEEGIAYILKHPFLNLSDNLENDFEKYQQKVLEELSKKSSDRRILK